jgi:hypothetical protein
VQILDIQVMGKINSKLFVYKIVEEPSIAKQIDVEIKLEKKKAQAC